MLSISKWLKEIPEEESKKTVKKKTAKKAKKKTSLKSPEKSKSKKEKVQTAPPPAVSDSVSYEILSVESAGFCSFCEREKDKKNPYSRVIRLTGKGSKENFQVNICRPCITKVHILEVRAQA